MPKYLFSFIFIAILASGFYYRYQLHEGVTERAKPTPSVVVTKVTKSSLADKVEALGTTRANEHVVLTANVSDYIVELNFSDGEQVKKGKVLARLNTAQQQALLSQAKVDLAQQQREYRRIEDLVRRKTIASSELDQLQSQIDLAQARIAEAQAAIDDRILKAPFSGELGLRQVSVGALVAPGTAITTLDDTSVLKLDFEVPEQFYPVLKPGDEIVAKSAAYRQRAFKGRIATIDPRIDETSRAFTVRALLPNKHQQLAPGMLMQVTIVRNPRQAIVIPEEALIALGKQQYVYILDDDNIVHQQPVTIGTRQRGRVEITAGLATGQCIITRGKLKVRLGQQVEVQQEDWRGASS